MRKAVILILACLAICCSDNNRIQRQVENLWNKPNKTVEDFNYFYKLVSKNPVYLDSLVDVQKIKIGDELDQAKLKKFFFNEVIDTAQVQINVNMFLENSASMFGYFEGQTKAETTIAKILVHSGYFFGKENLTFSFITDKIYEQQIEGQVTGFINRLEPSNMRVGSVAKTRIADIIKTVINNTRETNVSILISDCIYSLETGKDIKQRMSFEWAIIEEAFLNLLKDTDASVLINKYVSNFKGKYFVLNNSTGKETTEYVGENELFERPYYVIAIGETNLLKEALKEISFSEYPGYQNSYLITSPRPSDRIDYRILNSFKKGSFRPDKKDYKHTIIRAKKGAKGNDKGLFQYTIAANLKDIQVETSYLLDATKYKVSGNYSPSIQEVSEELIRRDPSLKDYTHLISLQTDLNLREEEIQVSLKRETPKWIEETHTEEDHILTREYQYKTRGFKYLVEGIESAFYQAQKRKSTSKEENKYYFTLTTKIKL
jgi:hypothetical protein